MRSNLNLAFTAALAAFAVRAVKTAELRVNF